MEPSKKEIEKYWKEVLKRNLTKSNVRNTVYRLGDKLLMEYLVTTTYDYGTGRSHYIPSLEEFWDSKRPYGNKDVCASIMYNSGWDYKQFTQYELPDFVEEECIKLHEEVKSNLDSQQTQLDVMRKPFIDKYEAAKSMGEGELK